MLTKIWCGTIEIADGSTALTGPVRMPGRGRVQTFEPIRSEGPVNIDRVGKSYDVSFTVNRVHASRIAAALFRASHRLDLPNVADLVMTWTVGSTTIRATIANAAWLSTDPELTGIATRTSYQVTGGPLATYEETAERITEAGDTRISEAGDTRIFE